MNRLTAYDPFADVFPQLFRGLTQPARTQLTRFEPRATDLRIDVTEADDAYTVHADVPGVGKEDINVEIDGNRVSISADVNKPAGDLPQDEAADKERVLRTERYRGAVSRSFVLESEIDEDAASASYENGVLALTLPKKVVAGAKRLSIN